MKPVKQSKATFEALKYIETIVKTKSAKRGIKLLRKHGQLDFVFAMPGLVKSLLSEGKIQIIDNTLNILLHNPLKFDVMDHMMHFAILPLMLGRPELNVHIVSINSEAVEDTPTTYRKVFDYFIAKELTGTFSAEMFSGSMQDIVGQFGASYFNVAINNELRAGDLADSKDDVSELVSNGVPYVISDVAPNLTLQRYNIARSFGLGASSGLHRSKHGVRFKKNTSAEYFYSAHYLIVDRTIEAPTHIAQEQFNTIDELIVERLEQGDPLTSPYYRDHGSYLEIMPFVTIDKATSKLSLSHFGNDYQATAPTYSGIPLPTGISMERNMDELADDVYFAFVMYANLRHLAGISVVRKAS